MNDIVRPDGRLQITALLFVYEQLDMFPDATLLIDDPEPEARALAFEVAQHVAETLAGGIDHRLLSAYRIVTAWGCKLS